MTISLKKGQKADLTKNNPSLQNLVVGMGWRANSMDLDLSAFLLRENGKVSGDEDLIFYGNPIGGSQSVEVLDSTKRSVGGQSDQGQVAVRLRQVPAGIERISFALTIHEGDIRGHNFSSVNNTYIRVVDEATGAEVLRYDLGKDFPVETAIVVGELYRYNGEWKFNAVGAGYSGGLEALCASFGIEVKGDSSPTPAPAAPPIPAKEPQVSSAPQGGQAAPIQLSKISLKKRGDVINLQKKNGSLGEIIVNLNWNQKKPSGLFKRSSGGVDLDLACLFELKDGRKSVVQALGKSFGALNTIPYIALDGDDRTGAASKGENLRINGSHVSEIKRILVFAFIYEGVTNWAEADGVVTISQSGGPDIEVRMDEHDNRNRMCAIALIENVDNQTFSIKRLVQYFSGHRELDEAFGWGLNWQAGRK